jgi:hypothetical protein
LTDSKTDNHVEAEEALPLAKWQKCLAMEGDTAASTTPHAKSTAGQYKRSHKVWNAFQASLTRTTLTMHNVASKDISLPGWSDDYVNCGLA